MHPQAGKPLGGTKLPAGAQGWQMLCQTLRRDGPACQGAPAASGSVCPFRVRGDTAGLGAGTMACPEPGFSPPARSAGPCQPQPQEGDAPPSLRQPLGKSTWKSTWKERPSAGHRFKGIAEFQRFISHRGWGETKQYKNFTVTVTYLQPTLSPKSLRGSVAWARPRM